MSDTPSLDEISTFAASIADQARPVALKHFRRPLAIDTKADESPVTVADREVETFLRRSIAERYPDHGVLGEEFGRDHVEAAWVWSVDPIDGTRSFISGNPLWGSLLAVLHDGEAVFGQIDMPATGERWTGALGRPSTFMGRTCRTRNTRTLDRAILCATDPDIFNAAERGVFESLAEAVYLRRFGGDCYNYGLLAAGHIDLVVEADLQPYDYLPLLPVVQGAGGVMTDWEGRPLGLASGARVLAAANPALHEAALKQMGKLTRS